MVERELLGLFFGEQLHGQLPLREVALLDCLE